MCVYVYMHTCMYVWKSHMSRSARYPVLLCVYAYTCIFVRMCKYVCMLYVCMHKCMCVCTQYAHVCTRTCVYTHTRILRSYIYMHACMFVHINAYLSHVWIHTQIVVRMCVYIHACLYSKVYNINKLNVTDTIRAKKSTKCRVFCVCIYIDWMIWNP